MTPSSTKRIKVLFIFLILGFIIYGNTFGNEFIWDDYDNIVNNAYIRDLGNLDKFFSQNLIAGAGKFIEWYRPVLLFSYALDYQFWGYKPAGYHLINLILHIFSAFFLYLVIVKIFKNCSVALLCSLFFLIHPVQTEAVTYISGRADLLFTFFLLGSLYYFLIFEETLNKKYLIGSLSLFLIALFSKETAIIFPFLLVLYYSTLKRNSANFFARERFLKISPFLVPAGFYFLIRQLTLGPSNLITSLVNYELSSFFHRTLVFAKSTLSYWKILILPTNLHYRLADDLIIQPGDFGLIFGILFLFAPIFISIFAKKIRKFIIFAFGWFFIGIFPSSNILIPINYVVGERWLYFSAIGFFIVLAVLLNQLLNQPKFKKGVTIVTIVIGILFSVIAIDRNRDWKNEISFFSQTLEYFPDNARMHADLAIAYAEGGNNEKALAEFRRSIELNPDEPNIHFNFGVFFQNNGNLEAAAEEYELAIKTKGAPPKAYDNLASVYVKLKRYDDAIAVLEKLSVLLPSSWKPLSLIAQVYLIKNNREKSVEYYTKALNLDPQNEELRIRLEALKE